MNRLTKFSTPQLNCLHRGKVRDSFRVDAQTRLIVSTDRISAFDRQLNNALPGKGDVLTMVANMWFEKTKHIIPNHLIKQVDPRASLVREAEPIRVEMIVRGFLTGSAWRKYEKGGRTLSGATLPEGMSKNQPFEKPIITPTTKDVNDTPITPEQIIATGLVDQKIYEQMEKVSLELFSFGSEYCASKGLILVDTKYEFGLIDGKLVLIDEIHTPDSSRFWDKNAYEKDPQSEQWLDKEFIRQWMLSQGEAVKTMEALPAPVVLEAAGRYYKLYEALMGESFFLTSNLMNRLQQNLVHAGLIKPGYVAIIMASKGDMDHASKIKQKLEGYPIMVDMRMVSAHKNGEHILSMASEYNYSIEPGAAIAIAGRSNGLGGALSANFTIPVINCPPFEDYSDLVTNVNSSLVMPSKASAATVVDPGNAAQIVLRCLNIPELKEILNAEIQKTKVDLVSEDARLMREFRCQEPVASKEPVGVGV